MGATDTRYRTCSTRFLWRELGFLKAHRERLEALPIADGNPFDYQTRRAGILRVLAERSARLTKGKAVA